MNDGKVRRSHAKLAPRSPFEPTHGPVQEKQLISRRLEGRATSTKKHSTHPGARCSSCQIVFRRNASDQGDIFMSSMSTMNAWAPWVLMRIEEIDPFADAETVIVSLRKGTVDPVGV